MNILVIGNGFDLAHGLPTTYKDFLEYLKEKDKNFSDKRIEDEFDALISNNLWVDYFLQEYKKMIDRGGNGWIDFESEISYIVQSMEQARQYIIDKIGYREQSVLLPDNIYITIKPFIEQEMQELSMQKCTLSTFDNTKEKILDDLNRLTRALEIYMVERVENENISKKSPDIQEIDVDCILNFNYTETYKRIYAPTKTKTVLYDYIHGKADITHTKENCNLVLGIDEYLKGEGKNKNTTYIEFKKFYQRIYKKTGCQYKDWIAEVNKRNQLYKGIDQASEEEINVYIFGHSLDITDKDILHELIDRGNGTTTIFYHNKKALSKSIMNMVKLIGEDNLIKRVSGENATIIFKEQKPMI